MTARARQEVDDVVASYDFGHFTNVMDVGGGTGTLLARILAGHPHLRGTLFDRPAVIPLARDHLATAGVADRCTFIGGDFFESLPSGNDLHILSRVIHDWGDEDAARILVTCRSAIAQGGALLLVETVLPDHAADNPAAIRMDLHMLVLFASRERSAMEYEHLLTASGFTAPRIVPTASPAGLALIEARDPEPGVGRPRACPLTAPTARADTSRGPGSPTGDGHMYRLIAHKGDGRRRPGHSAARRTGPRAVGHEVDGGPGDRWAAPAPRSRATGLGG